MFMKIRCITKYMHNFSNCLLCDERFYPYPSAFHYQHRSNQNLTIFAVPVKQQRIICMNELYQTKIVYITTTYMWCNMLSCSYYDIIKWWILRLTLCKLKVITKNSNLRSKYIWIQSEWISWILHAVVQMIGLSSVPFSNPLILWT